MMTKEDFQKLWTLNYPDTVPISHFFKHDYTERWFRIHSLPQSKRYAENNADWKILLSRQNEIITDLFGVDTSILIVTGEYNNGGQRTIHITDEEEAFKVLKFTTLDYIELSKIDPKQHDESETYLPAFATITWKPNYHENILRDIANDKIRAFFVSFDKNVIIAPYDGGIDIILKDRLTMEYFKSKYKHWLSKRADGF